mgnify:CR=1 FL=1
MEAKRFGFPLVVLATFAIGFLGVWFIASGGNDVAATLARIDCDTAGADCRERMRAFARSRHEAGDDAGGLAVYRRLALDGDAASAFNPLGDLYKTQLRQLARALGVPQAIIDKAPTADLWAGQTDEGELGFTYAEVDKLLYLLVDERYTPDECVEAGFERKFVDVVVKRIQRYHYKRVMPPIAKLGNRTVGYDFLYLRDWGT